MKTVGTGVTGLSVLGSAGATAGQEDSQVAVTFDDQTTGGQEIVVAAISTSVDVRYTVSTKGHEIVFARGQLEAGADRQDFTVPLNQPLKQDRRLYLSVYPSEGGGSLAREPAAVSVSGDITYLDGLSVTRVDADPDSGFQYPYFLYAPSIPEVEAGGPILVEPNNTGTATDDFEEHEERAEELITSGFSRDISGRLGVPMLVPVFPRPRSDPVDGSHYVHQLDKDTMQISNGPLERVDLQLLRMVEHAQQKLDDASYPVADDIIMNGFSASGNFVDRFTVLHPDRVLSVTGGGLNGMALLPLEEAKGHTLDYHIGIANVEELIGQPADLEALDEVNQFLYMGSEDSNDTIPYDDAWTSEEMRQTALEVYGEDMIAERFPYCQSAYEEAGVEAQFRIYEGAGHTPRPAKEDIVSFHKRSIEGKDVSEFGRQLGLRASFDQTPTSPTIGEPVEFDATGSRVDLSEIIAYTWDFGDGETAAGKTVTHSFEEAGEYTILLTVIDGTGRSAEIEDKLTVEGQSSSAETDTEATTSTAETELPVRESTSTDTAGGESSDGTETRTDGDDTTSTGAPGFGIGVSLTSIGGAAYLLDRVRNEPEE